MDFDFISAPDSEFDDFQPLQDDLLPDSAWLRYARMAVEEEEAKAKSVKVEKHRIRRLEN